MGLKNLLKKGAEQFITEVVGIGREATATLNVESITHQEVLQLYNDVNIVYAKNKTNLEPDVEKAAKSFLDDLNELLQKDSNQSPLKKHHPTGQVKLAQDAIDIIYKHKPKLESSPGFWNQLKAHINVFIERTTGIKDALSTNKTQFYKAISKKQERVEALRHDMSDKIKGP
ncbi:hypothetical protein [Legionella sp. W05-934-2]|uniref:hypothetical protein n=1 Tax=Legionella sp. W05-934-2 TaxID=1198649 RepID=UPI0034622203